MHTCICLCIHSKRVFDHLLLLLFSCWVVSDSLRPHGLPHARLPCPSPSPRACPHSCPLSWWCLPTVLSSLLPFSSCPQSFLASRSFPLSWLFASGGQSIGASCSLSISPSSEYSGLISFRIDWFGLLAVQGSLKSILRHQFESISSLALSLFYCPALTSVQDYWKNHSFDYMDFWRQSNVCFLIYYLGLS